MFLVTLTNSLRQWRGDFLFRTTLPFFFAVMLLQPLHAQPKVEITNSKQHFGSVKRGEVLKIHYELKNTGNAPLLLFESEVSCSCTSVEFSQEPVAPGKSTLVIVTFDTKSVWGRQDRYVYISSNAIQPEIALRYKGHVSKD